MNNQIRDFLNNSLVDMFCNWCKEWNNMSEEEIHDLFMGVDGLEMNDYQFVCENVDEIDDDAIYDEVWCYVKEVCEEFNIPLHKLVSFLASRFYLYEYDNNDKEHIQYIKDTSLSELINDFNNNGQCGMDFIKAYLMTEANLERYQETRRRIKDNKDDKPLIEFEKVINSRSDILELPDYEQNEFDENHNLDDYVVKVCMINQLLRDVICNLYNYYVSMGYPDIDALNYTWNYFTRNFDPLGELDKMGFDSNTKEWYKHYMLSLIYADLYEDVCNTSIIQSENFDDRLANVLPLIMIQIGVVSIPKEESVRNRLLKHFILLQDDKEKMSSNRKKTYSDNRINVLKKVNPTYFLDEFNVNK